MEEVSQGSFSLTMIVTPYLTMCAVINVALWPYAYCWQLSDKKEKEQGKPKAKSATCIHNSANDKSVK